MDATAARQRAEYAHDPLTWRVASHHDEQRPQERGEKTANDRNPIRIPRSQEIVNAISPNAELVAVLIMMSMRQLSPFTYKS